MSSQTPITPVNVSAQKSPLQAKLSALLNGLNTDLAGVDSIDVDGVSTKRTDLTARIQTILDAISAVKAARSTLQQAVARQLDSVQTATALRKGLKRFLSSKYGPTNPKLQDFGFTPQRLGKATVAVKAQAKVKAKATRELLGTKGSQQRKAASEAASHAVTTAPAPAAPATVTPPAATSPAASPAVTAPVAIGKT